MIKTYQPSDPGGSSLVRHKNARAGGGVRETAKQTPIRCSAHLAETCLTITANFCCVLHKTITSFS